VKSTERACPFCAASIVEAFAAVPEARAIPSGLSRAALVALAAASIGGSACGGESTPAYGAPVPPTGGTTGSGGAIATGGGFAQPYGVPPLTGGTPGSGGTIATGGGFAQPYGVPPLTGGTPGSGGRPATGGSAQEPADAADDGSNGGTTSTGGTPPAPPYGIPPIPAYGAPPSKK
jgi:hypothetical protein